VPSHLLLSPFPQNQPKAMIDGRFNQFSEYQSGGSSRSGNQTGETIYQHQTHTLSLSPVAAIAPTRNKLNDTVPKRERLSVYSTEQEDGDKSDRGSFGSTQRDSSNMSARDNDSGLRVAHLHSQLTAAASRDRSSSALRNVARVGVMFNTMEYASSSDSNDGWGDEDGDDMRNAVMF
jgi:hypothetical protein